MTALKFSNYLLALWFSLRRISGCCNWLPALLLLAGSAYADAPGGASLNTSPEMAQAHRRVDSLQALVLAHSQLDTVRALLLMSLADEMAATDVRAAAPVLRQAVRLTKQLKYRDFEAEALLMYADYHISLASYDLAIMWLRQSEAGFARLRNTGGVMRCQGRLARIAEQQGRYAVAVDHALRGMAMSSTGDERRFHTSLAIQMGGIYSRIGDYQLAKTYLDQAFRVSCYHDYPDRINLILGEMGELNRRQRQWPDARRYYAQSRAVSLELNDHANVLLMDLNLAEMNEQLGDYTAVQQMSFGVLRRIEAAHRVLLLPRIQALLARTHLHSARTDSALWYGTRSLRLSQETRSQEGVRAASAVLAKAYAQRGDFAQAYEAQQRFTAYNDSLSGAELLRRAAAVQLSSERRQQQGQLTVLRQELELEQLRQQRRQMMLAGLALLLALGGAAMLWLYRQRQQRRVTALRNSLAADLHDDVGSLLSQISMQSGLLQEGFSDGAGQRRQLGQISDASRSAVRQLNDVVWTLDAHNDHLPDLLDRMRDYAADVLGAAGLEVSFAFPAELPNQRLSVHVRRNLYLIYKESLHNVVKHATGATAVHVSLRVEPGTPAQLLLEVVDNGQACTSAAPAGPTRRSGHGLRNMQERAQALGGTAATGRGPTGFAVSVAVPLPSAWKRFGLSSMRA